VLLGNRSLYDPDEGRYAEIPREMLQHGDWIIPHLNGLVYLEKPPLQYWLTAMSFRWLGENDFSARLVPGIAGYLLLVVVHLLGRRLWGGDAGLKAVLLTGASLLFVLLAHQLTLDMLLTFCLTAALACFLSAQSVRNLSRCRSWMLGCWAAMGFAVLTKGLIGIVVPAGSVISYAVWQKDWRVFRSLHLLWGLPVFAVVAAPWFVLAARANHEFLAFFFIREHFLRFLTPIEDRSEPWWFFVPVLALGILPWAPLAGRALLVTWRRGVPGGHFDPARVLWAWSVFTFVFFSLSNAKLVTYVLPVVPALALLCARPAADEPRSIRWGATLSIVAGLAIIVYLSGAWSTPRSDLLAKQMLFGLSLAAGLLAASAILCLVLLLRQRTPAALSALCAGWFLACAALLLAGGEVQRSFSGRETAELLNSVAARGAPVYSVQYYEQSLPFYLKRPVILVDYRDEFALGLDEAPGTGIADLGTFAMRWRDAGDAYAVMRVRTYDALAAQGLPMREVGRIRHRVIVSRR
jgi:4-amino-4-deoxy-L-arabinose transferase-like glycosyltransferase